MADLYHFIFKIHTYLTPDLLQMLFLLSLISDYYMIKIMSIIYCCAKWLPLSFENPIKTRTQKSLAILFSLLFWNILRNYLLFFLFKAAYPDLSCALENTH